MMSSIGLPELMLVIAIALTAAVWPVLFFGFGYYLGRRSARRDTNVTPADAASGPPHV
jgi:hypothetical protein